MHFGDHQIGMYLQGSMGIKPELPVALEALEARAREKLDPRAYWYVAGGAGSEDTVRENRRAFGQWRLTPRMLRDVSMRDYHLELFGQRLLAPLILAPVGVQEILHPDAELAVARAAAATGVPFMLSTLSSRPLEEVATAMGNTPRFFQLYWPAHRELTKSLLGRAEAAGYSAVAVTLDTRLMGWRCHDLEEAYLPFLEGKGIANYTTDPVFRGLLEASPEEDPRGAVAKWAEIYADPHQTWEDLRFIQENSTLPVLLKGILHPADAQEAVQRGVAGIIVSNHGGRQVDGAVAALDALPGICKAVNGKAPVLFDSGIRGGADIVKALALGARAVLLGRPYLWGLAVGGEAGVREVVQRTLADFDVTMALCGFRTLEELSPEALVWRGKD